MDKDIKVIISEEKTIRYYLTGLSKDGEGIFSIEAKTDGKTRIMEDLKFGFVMLTCILYEKAGFKQIKDERTERVLKRIETIISERTEFINGDPLARIISSAYILEDEIKGFEIRTAKMTLDERFFTQVKHPNFHNGFWIELKESFTKEEAQDAHSHFCKLIENTPKKELVLKDWVYEFKLRFKED